jgi:hypothetical protein
MNSTLAPPNPAPSRRFTRPSRRSTAFAAVAAVLVAAAVLPTRNAVPLRGSVVASHGSVPGTTASAPQSLAAGRVGFDAVKLPLDPSRAAHVAAATLVLVDGRAGLARSVDKARADLKGLGGHTVSYNETEGRPTSTDPCPVPIDGYASGGLRPVAFPCPVPGQQADSAQLVMAVPVPKVQALLGRMGGYGEILGRATQIVDAQQSLDDNAAHAARLERQIARLRHLIAATAGDTSALRGQLAQKVGELANLEDRSATTTREVTFGQVALNLTTVRPPDKPAGHNAFVRSVQTGWHRLARFAQRVVTLLVVLLPPALVVGLIALPIVRRRRRTAQPTA